MDLDDDGRASQQSSLPVEGPEWEVPEIITMPSRFEQIQDKGYIDVWWLYDDGGYTEFHVGGGYFSSSKTLYLFIFQDIR